MVVRRVPNGTLILTRPLMAHPLASRMGPRVRWRSFNQAMSIEGPEMTMTMPTSTSGYCHAAMPKTWPRIKVSALMAAVAATPIAATVPMSTFLGSVEAAGLAVSALVVFVAVSAIRLSEAASAAAARLATISSMARRNFL